MRVGATTASALKMQVLIVIQQLTVGVKSSGERNELISNLWWIDNDKDRAALSFSLFFPLFYSLSTEDLWIFCCYFLSVLFRGPRLCNIVGRLRSILIHSIQLHEFVTGSDVRSASKIFPRAAFVQLDAHLKEFFERENRISESGLIFNSKHFDLNCDSYWCISRCKSAYVNLCAQFLCALTSFSFSFCRQISTCHLSQEEYMRTNISQRPVVVRTYGGMWSEGKRIEEDNNRAIGTSFFLHFFMRAVLLSQSISYSTTFPSTTFSVMPLRWYMSYVTHCILRNCTHKPFWIVFLCTAKFGSLLRRAGGQVVWSKANPGIRVCIALDKLGKTWWWRLRLFFLSPCRHSYYTVEQLNRNRNRKARTKMYPFKRDFLYPF